VDNALNLFGRFDRFAVFGIGDDPLEL